MLSFQRWFLPKSIKSKSKNQQIRAKFLAVNASASIVWGPLVVPVVIYLDSPLSATLVALGALFSFFGALTLKYTGNLVIASSIYLGGIFIMLVILSLVNGGTNFSGFVWLLMLPILATDSMGDRAGVITLVGCLLLLLGLKTAESLGVVFPSETSTEGHAFFRFISLVVITAMIWAIGSAYSKLMRSALRKEQELSKMKSKFISNVSHELRTPLNGIIGMLEVIQQKEVESGLADDLNTVRYSSLHLLKLVNDLLELTNEQTVKTSLRNEEYNIRENIRNIYNSLVSLADKKGISLEYKIDSSVPKVLIGDSTKVDQLVMNFLSNGIKFTPTGSVTLSLSAESFDDKVNLKFTIEDTGIGISEKDSLHLFDPFYQVDDSFSREQVGSGLGLAISKCIVEALKGKVSVKSIAGEGSCFQFNIIQNQFLANEEEQSLLLSHGSSETVKVNSVLQPKNKKILLAEDNVINQTILKRMLEFNEHSVVCVNNGQQALKRLQQDSFDIVLMDVQMPVMDGIECCRKIRDELALDIPIIAVTANASEKDRRDCINAGMNDVLPKPVITSVLYEKLTLWLQA